MTIRYLPESEPVQHDAIRAVLREYRELPQTVRIPHRLADALDRLNEVMGQSE